MTNTPLQALTLLNDEQFVEFARGLAAAALAKPSGDDRAIARDLFRRCLVRPPDGNELAALVTFYGKSKARFDADAGAAEKILAGPGATSAPPADKHQSARLAAWTLVARSLLNLDEAITKD